MKRKAILKLGIVLVLVTSLFLSYTFYCIIKTTNVKVTVPVVKLKDGADENLPAFDKGHIIVEDDIEYEKVTKGMLNEFVVTNPEDIIGCYVTRPYYPNEHFYYNSLALDYPKRLAEKIRYNGIAVPVNLLKTVNGEINEDDFVRISIVLGNDSAKKDILNASNIFNPDAKIIDTDYLQAVRVVGMYEGDGSSSTEKRDSSGPNVRNTISPSFLILDVDEVQRALLMNAKTTGSIEITIIPESVQEYYRQAWGLSKDNSGEDLDEDMLNDITQQHEEVTNLSEKEGQEIADQEYKNAENMTEEQAAEHNADATSSTDATASGDLTQMQEIESNTEDTNLSFPTDEQDAIITNTDADAASAEGEITDIKPNSEDSLQNTEISEDTTGVQDIAIPEGKTVVNNDAKLSQYTEGLAQLAIPASAPNSIQPIPEDMKYFLATLN